MTDQKQIGTRQIEIDGKLVTIRILAPSGHHFRERRFADPVRERERMADIHTSASYEYSYGH